jgi:hypothetical protein
MFQVIAVTTARELFDRVSGRSSGVAKSRHAFQMSCKCFN